MASPPLESSLARAGAIAFAWALFVGGWLVLGALGRSTTPLWFAGLGPVAAWLAVAGAATVFARGRAPSRDVVAAAAALTLVGLASGIEWGSGLGTFAAATGWGVLSCAATWRAGVGDGAAFAPGCASPPRALDDPAAWPAFGARWAMLPMMAALAVQSDWCAGIGVTAGQGVALHLAAMLAPVCLLRGWHLLRPRHSIQSPLWIAVFMAAGVAALLALPGVRGWMAMSLLHAVAWGVAWSQDAATASTFASRRAGRDLDFAWFALAPAAAVLALGAAIAVFGLDGLIAVHVGLGALSLAGAAAWIATDVWRHAQPEQEETLS